MEKYDLTRYKQAHELVYETALNEIKNGKKETHWMWYIFPQIHDLGTTAISHEYAIKDKDEAAAFLQDEYLGGHLREISTALLQLETNDPLDIFVKPDDLKLRSSMTLFSLVAGEETLFQEVLDKFFKGSPDKKTLKIVGK